MNETEAREILIRHGRDVRGAPLEVGEGYMNQVWIGADTVVRLSSGLLDQAMRYEFGVLAALPAGIPHPRPIAHGRRREAGEYLVMERVPGDRLDHAWPDLSVPQRRRIGHQAGRALAALHRLPLRGWMVNPFMTAAFAGDWTGALYAPPRLLPELVGAARPVRPEHGALWDAVLVWGAQRQHLFADDVDCFTHCDLHARNIMVRDGNLAALLDFEGSRLSAAETDVFGDAPRAGRQPARTAARLRRGGIPRAVRPSAAPRAGRGAGADVAAVPGASVAAGGRARPRAPEHPGDPVTRIAAIIGSELN